MDAGQFYREALSIASACLDAADPLVVTSRNNLNEFHRALGLVDTEAPQNIDVAMPIETDAPVQTSVEPAHDRNIVTTVPTSSQLPRQAIAAGVAMGVALLAALAIWLTRAPAEQPTTEQTRIVEERLSAFGDPLVPVTPSTPSQDNAPSPPPSTETIAERPVPATHDRRAKTTISAPKSVDAKVLEASLCQSLSTSGGRWECTRTSDPEAGDSLYFYSRIAVPTSIRIHHRWFRNGTLRQDVGLVVDANPSAGYRTYSRRRVEAGDWRVAIVDDDGAVLGEETVEVR
jgi:hypothetical protein